MADSARREEPPVGTFSRGSRPGWRTAPGSDAPALCCVASFRPNDLAMPYWNRISWLRTDTSGAVTFVVLAVSLCTSEYLRLRRKEPNRATTSVRGSNPLRGGDCQSRRPPLDGLGGLPLGQCGDPSGHVVPSCHPFRELAHRRNGPCRRIGSVRRLGGMAPLLLGPARGVTARAVPAGALEPGR